MKITIQKIRDNKPLLDALGYLCPDAEIAITDNEAVILGLKAGDRYRAMADWQIEPRQKGIWLTEEDITKIASFIEARFQAYRENSGGSSGAYFMKGPVAALIKHVAEREGQ